CHVCTPEASQDCLELDPVAYTGGEAVCNAEGTAWEFDGCTFCGDAETNGNEACDPSDGGLVATTCGDLGFAGTNSGEAVDSCNANCTWDTSESGCSRCPGDDCLEDTSCNGTACNGQECGSGTCSINC